MKEIPETRTPLGECSFNPEIAELEFCSNFDGVINQEVVEALRAEKHYADYPAWGWHGDVWYEDGEFHCRVMRYHSHVDTMSAVSPEALKEDLCEKWGSS